MTELQTHDRPARITKPRNGKPRADGVVLVSGNQLSRHLGISRQAVDALAAQRVVVRRSDGFFDQDAARLAYLAHLKSARRGSARSEADAAFAAAKTRLAMLRVQEREGQLIELSESIATIDKVVGIMLTHLGSMPAIIGGRDLQLRRRVEQCVYDTRVAISEAASKMADERGEPEEIEA
jgi:hypothetical protein